MCYSGEADLDGIFFAVLEHTVSWLHSQKLDISEDTIRLFEKMKGNKS
jgi:hypothetical protein